MTWPSLRKVLVWLALLFAMATILGCELPTAQRERQLQAERDSLEARSLYLEQVVRQGQLASSRYAELWVRAEGRYNQLQATCGTW